MKADPVAITGIGLVTPAGVGTRATWNGLLSGRPTSRTDPILKGLPVDFSCQVTDLNAPDRLPKALARRLNRFAQMAIIAATEAVNDAQLDPASWDAERVAVVIGTGTTSLERLQGEITKITEGRPRAVSPLTLPRGIPNMSAGEVSLHLGARGPSLVTATACASGATALGTALLMLRNGVCDIAITGGAESVCDRISSVCFSQLGALSTRREEPAAASRPFDTERDGFVLSEGAGILVLERTAHARARGVAPIALLAGYGASCDSHHSTAPEPTGRGATAAMNTALADAGLTPHDIDHISAHGTGTPLNDTTERRTLLSLFTNPPPVTSLKGVLGHSIGAAGAIEAAAAALTLYHQIIPPTGNHHHQDPGDALDIVTAAPRSTPVRAVLSNSFGFGGQNAVLVLTTP